MNYELKNRRTTITLDDNTFDKIRVIADTIDSPFPPDKRTSEVIRRAVDNYAKYLLQVD